MSKDADGIELTEERADWDAIDYAIDTLNRINRADPNLMPAMINNRYRTNQAVADDPSVQVARNIESDGVYFWEVGFLGILNGIFGTDSSGIGHIAAVMSDEQQVVVHFERSKDHGRSRA